MAEEHPFKKIVKDIKNDDLPQVCLLFGEEDYLVDWAAGSISNKFISSEARAFDLMKIDAESLELGQLQSACETVPLISEKKVVLLEGYKSQKRRSSESKADENRDKEEDGEYAEDASNSKKVRVKKEYNTLEEYIKNIPETCILIIKADYINKTSAMYKYAKKIGGAYEFIKLDKGTLADFIKKEFRNNGKQVDPGAVNKLIDMSGYFNRESQYGLYDFKNEIKKISDYANLDIINSSHVEEVTIPTLDDDIFNMLDAITSGKSSRALTILYGVLQEKNKEFMVMGMIVSHMETVLMISEMLEDGYDLKEIASELKMHPFRVQKASKMARALPYKRLRRIFKDALMMEGNVKSGLLEPGLSVETFLLSIN